MVLSKLCLCPYLDTWAFSSYFVSKEEVKGKDQIGWGTIELGRWSGNGRIKGAGIISPNCGQYACQAAAVAPSTLLFCLLVKLLSWLSLCHLTLCFLCLGGCRIHSWSWTLRWVGGEPHAQRSSSHPRTGAKTEPGIWQWVLGSIWAHANIKRCANVGVPVDGEGPCMCHPNQMRTGVGSGLSCSRVWQCYWCVLACR